MLINTNNISIYGATLIEREFTNHEVVNVNDWLDGAPSPVFLREYTRYKNISLVFLVEAATEQIILDKIGLMVKQLRECTIKFSDLSFFYDAHLEGVIDMKKINNKAYRVEVELLAHNTYAAPVQIFQQTNISTTIQVDNIGTLPCPVNVSLKPIDSITVNFPTFTITGLTTSPLVLLNLQDRKMHKVDSETMRYLKEGANDIGNFSGFEFPMLQPGINNILLSSIKVQTTIDFKPKFN